MQQFNQQHLLAFQKDELLDWPLLAPVMYRDAQIIKGVLGGYGQTISINKLLFHDIRRSNDRRKTCAVRHQAAKIIQHQFRKEAHCHCSCYQHGFKKLIDKALPGNFKFTNTNPEQCQRACIFTACFARR